MNELISNVVNSAIKAVCQGLIDELNLTRKEISDTLEELAGYFRY